MSGPNPAAQMPEQITPFDVSSLPPEEDNLQSAQFDADNFYTSGASSMARLSASFAVTPDGRRRILESYLPDGHMLVDTKQGLAVYDSQAKTTFLVDPPMPEFPGDLADIAGDVPEIVGGTAGALYGGAAGLATGPGAPVAVPTFGVLGGGAGSGLGRNVRGTIGKMLGSGEGYGDMNQAGAFYEGAAGEMLPVAGAAAVRGLSKGLSPFARWMRKLGAEGGSGTSQANKDMARELGIPENVLKPGMVTESPLVKFGEARMEQHPVTADMYSQEIDRPYIEALHKAFGSIRNSMNQGLRASKRAMGLDWPIKSTIDADTFAGNLVRQVEGTRGLTKDLADQAWNDFLSQAPGGVDTPAEAVGLYSYLNRITQRGAKFPNTQKGVLKNVTDLMADVKKIETIQDLDNLRSIIGEQIYEKDMYGRHGPAIYSEIMGDMDQMIKTWGMPSESYDLYRSLWRAQHSVNNSKVVKKIFGSKMDIDVELLDDAAIKVFRSGSKEGIKNFRKMIGAETLLPEQAKTMHHLRGQYVYGQMKQLFMDRILLESFTEATAGRGVGFSGTILAKKLFRDIGEDNLINIFGKETTRQLKIFTQLMQNENIARSMYGNFSNTAMHNDLAPIFGIFQPIRWLKSLARLKGERYVGKQITKRQGEGAILGREFFTEGRVPDVGAQMRAKGQERPFESLLEGFGYKGPQIKTMIRAASQSATHLTPDATQGGADIAKTVMGSHTTTPGSRRPQR